MEALLPLANNDVDRVWLLDDEMCTFYLLYRKTYTNFENKFRELKLKEVNKK